MKILPFNPKKDTKEKSLCWCLFCFLKRQWGPFIWGLNEGRENRIQEQQMWSDSVQLLPATYRLFFWRWNIETLCVYSNDGADSTRCYLLGILYGWLYIKIIIYKFSAIGINIRNVMVYLLKFIRNIILSPWWLIKHTPCLSSPQAAITTYP